MSTARIFVSYRTADGVDKATALARDLNAVFGRESTPEERAYLAADAPNFGQGG